MRFFQTLFVVFFLSFQCHAGDQTPLTPQSSLSLYKETKHGNDFTHYEHVNPKAPKGGSLSLSVVGTFDSLNPFVIKGRPAAGLVPLYAHYFYATLMDQSSNEPFSQYAYAAERLEVAADNKSITFYLRENLTFHDGSPLTTDDVIFSFNTLREKGLPLYKAYYADVTGVEKVGKNGVRFLFKDDTNKELPLLLGTFPIFSKAYYTANDFNDASTTKIPVGSGPYRISKVDSGRKITYERVKDWWGTELPCNVGRYNFDEITYLYFRDPDVTFEAFKSRDFDVRIETEIKKWMTGYDKDVLASGDLVKIERQQVQAGIMSCLVMNTRRPIFQNKALRQALALVLDFEWINENYFYNQYERCDSYFWGLELASSGLPEGKELEVLKPYEKQVPASIFKKPYTLPKTDGTGRDRVALRQAKNLLKDAGYVVKAGRLVDPKTNAPIECEILLPSQTYTRFLNGYLKSLKRLGITAKFRIVDTAQYTSRIEDFDFDMTPNIFAQSNSPGNEQREFWGSKVAEIPGSRNLPGVKDPVVDALIEDLIDAPDRDTLVAITKALDRVLLNGHYVVPLWGSRKIRFAHWRMLKSQKKGEKPLQLKHTGNFSKYSFDMTSFWAERS